MPFSADFSISPSRFFIHLDPFNDDLTLRFTEIYQDSVIIEQEDSNHKFLTTLVPTLAEVKSFLNAQPALSQTIPALPIFIDGMEQQKFTVLPVYGRYFIDLDTSMSNILQVIIGARYAQTQGIDSFSKPLVIAVFYPYDEQANQVQDIIKNGGYPNEYSITEEQKKFLRNQLQSPKLNNLAEHFMVASINDPATTQVLAQLQPGEVLLLSMGVLPRTVFNGLYAYNGDNTWPSIYEGAGTQSLLFSSNKPGLVCDEDFLVSNPQNSIYYIINMDLKNELTAFKNVFCKGINRWSTDDHFNENFAQLIYQSKDPQSALSQYFNTIHMKIIDPENSRIDFAIKKIITML